VTVDSIQAFDRAFDGILIALLCFILDLTHGDTAGRFWRLRAVTIFSLFNDDRGFHGLKPRSKKHGGPFLYPAAG
jgi:hypothetical protein